MTRRMILLAAFTFLLAPAAFAAPNMSQTTGYIEEKTASEWKASRGTVLVGQIVTFPRNCEMLITHRFQSIRNPGAVLIDETFTIPVSEVYKLVASGGGISVRTKGRTINQQNVYYPAGSRFSKICGATSEPCNGPVQSKDSAYLDVIAPQDLYQEKVGKAMFRLLELCGAGKAELF